MEIQTARKKDYGAPDEAYTQRMIAETNQNVGWYKNKHQPPSKKIAWWKIKTSWLFDAMVSIIRRARHEREINPMGSVDDSGKGRFR